MSVYYQFRHKKTGLWSLPYDADPKRWWTDNRADAMDAPLDLLARVAIARHCSPADVEAVPLDSNPGGFLHDAPR